MKSIFVKLSHDMRHGDIFSEDLYVRMTALNVISSFSIFLIGIGSLSILNMAIRMCHHRFHQR